MKTHEINCLKLYQLMNHKDYLNLVTRFVSELCHSPILTMDYMHKVHSYEGSGNINDETWNEMIHLGYLKSERLHPGFHQTMKTLIEHKHWIRIHYEGSNMVLFPVFTEETFMGLIAALEKNHALQDEQIEYLQIMSDILSVHSERFVSEKSSSEYMHHHILYDLLKGKIPSKQHLIERMIERDWKPVDHYQLILIDMTDLSTFQQNYLKNESSIYFNNPKCILHQDKLIIIDENCTFSSHIISSWASQIKQHILISDPFEDLYELPKRFNQLSNALIYNKHSKKYIIHYDEFRLTDFLMQVESALNVDSYFQQDVLYLYHHQKDLYETLKAYLSVNQSMIETSLKLNIHKNTVSYRLKKLQDTFPLLLTDSNQVFHARLTIEFLENRNNNSPTKN